MTWYHVHIFRKFGTPCLMHMLISLRFRFFHWLHQWADTTQHCWLTCILIILTLSGAGHLDSISVLYSVLLYILCNLYPIHCVAWHGPLHLFTFLPFVPTNWQTLVLSLMYRCYIFLGCFLWDKKITNIMKKTLQL